MRRAGLVAMLGALAVLLGAPAGTSAKAHGTPQDRAATRAYLEAQYAYDQSQLATAGAASAASQALAHTLASECPGVLAAAPREPFPEAGPEPRLSARERGEANRHETQLGALRAELSFAIALPALDADRQAALAYAHTVNSLRWSSPAVTALEHVQSSVLEAQLAANPPPVCADMRAWAASGFQKLSAGTKIAFAAEGAFLRPLIQAVRKLGGDLAREPLAGYEGPHEQALMRMLADIRRRLGQVSGGVIAITEPLEVVLGLRSAAEAEGLASELSNGPPKGSIEIGHGRTAAGTSYAVWVVPKQAASGARSIGCSDGIAIFEHSSGGRGGSSENCLSRSHPEPPNDGCTEGQRARIEAQTLPSARTVRLNLSDGRQIISRVALVPAGLGGPAGIYYQVVRTRSSFPVSLTELDAHGRTLRTVALPGAHKCPKRAFPQTVGRPRTIARGSLPQGLSFSITGERSSFEGQSHFDVRAEVLPSGEAEGLVISGSGEGFSSPAGGRADPFARQLQTGCLPHEYAILYGVLKASRDTVLARTAAGLQALRRVPIPRSLHVHGVLAYIALASVPSELIARSPHGKTVFVEHLADRAREVRETCEGEAEPA